MLCPVPYLSGASISMNNPRVSFLGSAFISEWTVMYFWHIIYHHLQYLHRSGPPTALCFHSSHFSTHYLAYLWVQNSNLAAWQVTFWQLIIPCLSPTLCQKKGNPSFQGEKSRAFSGRWVRSYMFDLLKYLQKDSQMWECLSVSEGVSPHLPSVSSNRLQKFLSGNMVALDILGR